LLAGVWDCAGRPGRSGPGEAVTTGAPLSAEETLRHFYQRLSEGDLAGAHAFLSSEVRREYPRPRFDDGWRSVRRATLISATRLPGGATAAEVRLRACVEVVQRAGQGEQRAYYRGQVTLSREGDAYRVGPSALSQVDRC
jgi:ketosteroid isomerase-like protein